MGRDKKNREGGAKIVILSTSTSTQIPDHKTSKQQQQKDISEQHSKQGIRQGKLRKITKCLLTRFSYLQLKYHN